eukprot:GFUD01014441.1.p1 GENE.GFUD01014441.1~~GFUD01014441.1.p1  ORF type:complete len:768 (-),score=96.94 GFUD01014441.1:1466-3769(-)
MGAEDDNQNSILKGILQNGSSFNYPAVRFGRVPKREKAKINAAMHSSRMKNMETRVMAEMADDAKIIETVVRAHFDTCDYTADKIKPFIAKAQAEQNYTQCSGMTCPMKGRPEQSFLDQFSERFMNHVRQVCTFAKSIPGFKCLHHDDQVSLLKSCVFEVLLVRLSGLFDNQSLVCLNGDVIKRETISSMPAGNAKFLMDSVFELAQRINRFRLADAEIGLFCAVVIITADRPGLRNPEIVGQMQSKLKMVLQNILVPQHPENSTIFTELLTIIHDLRTLNTLHTEKFLQQARVTGEQVREAAVSRVPTGSPPTQSSLQQHLLYGSVGDWEDNQDRDSTGSRSPQSSDSHTTNHSYSFEDMRRSPMGSVSSSESLGSSETFSKLSVNDLKIHGVGSVLLNALTSPAITATCPNRKRDISRCTSENNIMRQEDHSSLAVERHQETKCPFKARKLDSPSDSGIDSPKAQGSQSTNTSVCSSPRSSMEEKVKEVEEETAKPERSESLEEQHPLLKRALQQPPQPFNMGGVTGFQDEVYHKKFRHSGRKDSNEPTSTQESAKSPSPGPSQAMSHSILASQLAAPPTYTQPIQNSNPHSQSVLASTLSRPIAIPRAKESEQRNEWLANLILEKGHGRSSGQPQSLLMCAPLPAHSNNIPTGLGFEGVRWRGQASTTPTTTCSGVVPHPAPGQSRHIPVPVAPTQPTSSLHPAQASPRPTSSAQPQIPSRVQPEASKNPHLKMALSGLPASTDSQPLNLSTRTPPPADVPTEA